MTLYRRYTRLPIRFAALGLERGSEKSSYFCTPRGARVIGWAGVDGIHFCFVPRYGEMVFAVNPMAGGGYVQPVSRNFEDFLRLVLACGDSAALEQAGHWTRERFEEFLAAERERRPDCAAALQTIAELGLTPMPDPYGYLETLRQEFDASALQPAAEAVVPTAAGPFPVVWNSSVHSRPRHRRPAKELAVDAVFRWGDGEWRVPKLYLCAEGVMVDYCVGVDAAQVKAFLEYCEETCGTFAAEPTEEQRDELERRNPLHVAFHSVLTVDGVPLRAKGGSSTFWVPACCGNEDLTAENSRTRAIVEHYGLDEGKAWVIWRSSYPWNGRRGSAAKSVSVHLSRDKSSFTATHLTDPQPGEEVPFVHPVTGAGHVLRVLESEPQTLPERFFRDADMEYPTHFTALTAVVEPPLTGVSLRDCAESDSPRGKGGCAAGVAIIGRKGAADTQQICAVSSSHFVPAEHITWRVVVQEKTVEDLQITLL